MTQLVLTPITGLPDILPGDSLGQCLLTGLENAGIALADGDILVLAQKIVSKAENRFRKLSEVSPSAEAEEIARITEKDPRFIQLVLEESSEVLRMRPGTIITEHKNGFVCANAGIDHSNVSRDGSEDVYLLLPENADFSAQRIRDYIKSVAGVNAGIVIIDSHGRAWRNGTVGVCIGLAGIPGLVDLRGEKDMYGYTLRVTMVAAADELAGAASLVMGEAAERVPAVHVRGFPFPLREGEQSELHRPKELDMFR
jgi:coenzyme F420-0:L-glutamate ligase/coenzyme F420-1:gamma-L-glutamate ligase